MGATTSKAAKTAGNAAKRQYPTRVPPTPKTTPQPRPVEGASRATASGPTVHLPPQASETRTEAINSDAFDPQFAASLRSLGPVTPNPTQSNSSTFAPPTTSATSAPIFPSASANPALEVLRARQELSDRADREFEALGRKGFTGREFLDVVQIRQILMMRDERNLANADIESRLGLKPGIVARLGKRGIVGGVGVTETAERGGALG